MNFYKDAFKLLRESRGFTFEEIGKRLKVSKQAVSNWESKEKEDKPRPKRVYDLAKILGCSAVDISDLKPEPEVIQMTGNGHNINGDGNHIGDEIIGAEFKGKKQSVTVLNLHEENAVRQDERKKILDLIMKAQEIEPSVKVVLYELINKES